MRSIINHDYEPDAMGRDHMVKRILQQRDIVCHSCKDQVIFEKNEVLSQSGGAYNVFTPYKNAWLKKLEPFFVKQYPVEKYAATLAAQSSPIPSLEKLDFHRADLKLATGMSCRR